MNNAEALKNEILDTLPKCACGNLAIGDIALTSRIIGRKRYGGGYVNVCSRGCADKAHAPVREPIREFLYSTPARLLNELGKPAT